MCDSYFCDMKTWMDIAVKAARLAGEAILSAKKICRLTGLSSAAIGWWIHWMALLNL